DPVYNIYLQSDYFALLKQRRSITRGVRRTTGEQARRKPPVSGFNIRTPSTQSFKQACGTARGETLRSVHERCNRLYPRVPGPAQHNADGAHALNDATTSDRLRC